MFVLPFVSPARNFGAPSARGGGGETALEDHEFDFSRNSADDATYPGASVSRTGHGNFAVPVCKPPSSGRSSWSLL